ncbi:MAG: RDD family protein [Mycobacterium sp.]|nr:RDD family protein [Mycobacterium sp.]
MTAPPPPPANPNWPPPAHPAPYPQPAWVLPTSGYTPWARRALALGIEQPAIFFVVIPIYLLWNFGHRQGKSGSSLGKAVLKFKVVSEKTWQPIGFWASVGRLAAHYVDQLPCFVGFLWPLWDAKRQTLADKIMSTVCVPLR